MTYRTRHPQISITHGDRPAPVDLEIATLILALWRQDISTHASCQGDDNA
jgi:hypothetical protein